MRSEERKNDNFTIIAADHRIFSDDVLWIYSGKMRTYRCKKQQDTFSHLYLHHHALRNDQCFSDRIFQKHPEWLPSGSGSGHPDPYFSSGICTDHRQATEIKCGRKRIHHLFQFRKSGAPSCNGSPW